MSTFLVVCGIFPLCVLLAAAEVAEAVDIGPGKVNAMTVSADDNRESLVELATDVSRKCLTESGLKSFSYDLYAAHSTSTGSTGDSREVSQVVTSKVETPTGTKSEDVVFGENDMWFMYTSLRNAQQQASASLRVTMLDSTGPERAAKIRADFSSDDLDVDETFEIEAQVPLIMIRSSTKKSCIENNWGRRRCTEVLDVAPTAELVMGSGFIAQKPWINASTGIASKKVFGFSDYASCLYFKWAESRP